MSRSLLKCRVTKHNSGLGPKLAVLVLTLLAPAAFADWFSDARALMGTEVSVYLWSDDPDAGQRALEEVFQEAARIDRLMSTYRDESEISKINREAAIRATVASPELFNLLGQALRISELTSGAFDITYDSVGQHFDFRAGKRPGEALIASEVEHIDYRLVALDDSTMTVYFREEGVRINLGGIAKGYVVERGVAILRQHGIEHAAVTAGGDTRLLGDRRGRPFMVGIRDPRRAGEVAISVPLVNEAISTSGDYERYFEEDGVRYHHIIKPSTGEPAGGVHSATVFGPDGVVTDALSTSVFVMGVERGLTLIGTLPDYESIVIDDAGRVFYSDGLVPPSAPTAD